MLLSNKISIKILLLICTIKIVACKYPIFYLYTRINPNTSIEIDEYNIRNSPYLSTRKSFFVIHGWNGAASNPWVLQIKNNLLAKDDANVIAVDWSEGSAGAFYPLNALVVYLCGFQVGEFLRKAAIPAAYVHCIGHSLGAHVCGFAGKRYTIGRITGMDPAGPGFQGQPYYNRLHKTDATYVDVIHTDVNLGIQEPIGHKNFYPNGGLVQAGCVNLGKRVIGGKGEVLVPLISCSHTRVTQLFAESILNNCTFTSVPCANYNDFKNNKCSCSKLGCPSMGFHSIDIQQDGNFYLDTNSNEPYSMN